MIKIPKFITPARGFALVGLTALALVVASVILTQTLNLAPCTLCIFQRMLYLLLAVLALIAAAWARGRLWFGTLALASALGGVATAVYQSWMQAFPKAVSSCGFGEPTPIESLVDWAGMQAPSLFFAWGECSSKEWVFLGLSIANWSAVVFAAFAGVMGMLLWSNGARARK